MPSPLPMLLQHGERVRVRGEKLALPFVAAPHPDPLPALEACEEWLAVRGERE